MPLTLVAARSSAAASALCAGRNRPSSSAPSGVRATRRLVRSNSGTPTRASRARIVLADPGTGDAEAGGGATEVELFGQHEERPFLTKIDLRPHR